MTYAYRTYATIRTAHTRACMSYIHTYAMRATDALFCNNNSSNATKQAGAPPHPTGICFWDYCQLFALSPFPLWPMYYYT